jgi:hypothetical protein
MIPQFQNREAELSWLRGKPDERSVLNIYGEAGIGKSSLLAKLKSSLETENPYGATAGIVLSVDLAMLGDVAAEQRPELFLSAFIRHMDPLISGLWKKLDDTAAQVAAQLIDLSYQRPVYLLFDTTETIQKDMVFWQWLEDWCVGPLAVDGSAHLIFAGRVPVPWRRFEIRRIAQLRRLEPLPTLQYVPALVQDTVAAESPQLAVDDLLPRMAAVISDLAAGHPELTIALARDAVHVWPEARSMSDQELRTTLCRRTVEPFINAILFEGIDDKWREILWWASVLNWFDLTTLPAYLREVEPSLHEDDYFFLQGVNRLRLQHTVVWRERQGDQLHGVIPQIVTNCLWILRPDDYRSANFAAARVLKQIVDQLDPDDAEANEYRREIKLYEERAVKGGAS